MTNNAKSMVAESTEAAATPETTSSSEVDVKTNNEAPSSLPQPAPRKNVSTSDNTAVINEATKAVDNEEITTSTTETLDSVSPLAAEDTDAQTSQE